MEKNIKKLVEVANSLGFKSFVFMQKAGPVNTFHFENMKMSDLVNIMIAGFMHVVNMEIKNHPEYTFERKALYGGLMNDFKDLVKKYDEKINADIKANGGK